VLSKFKKGLAKTRNGIFGKIGNIFSRQIDEELLEELEESLITADIGPAPAAQIIESLRKNKSDDLPSIS